MEGGPREQPMRLARERTPIRPLAMDLVERAEDPRGRWLPPPASAAAAEKFGGVGRRRFGLVCPPKVVCHAEVDDTTRELGKRTLGVGGRGVPTWCTCGGIRRGDRSIRDVSVTAGGNRRRERRRSELSSEAAGGPACGDPVTWTRPAARSRRRRIVPEHHSKGPSPVVFWTALGATGVAAGVATVFTVMIKSKHDDFVAHPSQTTADDGSSAQTRARIAWGVTAFAATTLVVGVLTMGPG